MKPSFVTWQLRRLHSELDVIDKRRGNVFLPTKATTARMGRNGARDRAARRALLNRMLRGLPKRLGFRDARAFVDAFLRANEMDAARERGRHRLSSQQVRELEQRVLANERPSYIAQVVGCAEQTVLNRATQLRKRLAACAEQDGTGI